jgi:hypothetical protein
MTQDTHAAAIARDGPVVRLYPAAVVLAVLAAMLAVAAGYRWFGESADYADYLDAYNGMQASSPWENIRYEPGYTLLSWLCKQYLNMPFALFDTLLAGLALALKFRLLWKYASAPIVAALVYLIFPYTMHEYIQIRSAVAIGLGYTALDAWLEKRHLTAIVFMLLAALFHVSALVLTAIAALSFFSMRLKPATIAAVFAGGTAAVYLLVSQVVAVLQSMKYANPLIGAYIDRTLSQEAPNLFSGHNILAFLVLVSSALFLRPWQDRKNGFFFLLGIWTLALYLALPGLQMLVLRITEMFLFAYFLFVFRFDFCHQSRIPAVMLTLFSLWMLWRVILNPA